MANSLDQGFNIDDQFDLSKSPVAVQQRDILKILNEEIEMDNKRLKYASFYIPASASTNSVFVGKVFTNAKSKRELALDGDRANELTKTLKLVVSQKEILGFDKVFEKLNFGVQKEFLKKYENLIAGLSDPQKFEKLEGFLKYEIEDAKSKVNNNGFLSSKKALLQKLNGVYVERVKETDEELEKMKAVDGEKAKIYKSLIQNLTSANQKYAAEQTNMTKLMEQLKNLMSGPQKAETRAKTIQVRSALDNSRIKLKSLKTFVEDAEERKRLFEQAYASEQIKKAVTENTNIVYNVSKSVLDSYVFPRTNSKGEKVYIEPNTTLAKQIDRVISTFVMQFKTYIQATVKSAKLFKNASIKRVVNNISNKLSDDFGKTIRDLKKCQKYISEALSGEDELLNDKSYKTELENDLLRLQNIEKKLIAALKKMGVEISEITAKKS